MRAGVMCVVRACLLEAPRGLFVQVKATKKCYGLSCRFGK
jgi:hypothetical protein